MGIVRTASRRVAGLFRERAARRPSAALRRGVRDLRPTAEDLEGRTLLSVGLDPTWGFGGLSQLNVPASTATNNYYQNIRRDRLAEWPGRGSREFDDLLRPGRDNSTSSLFVARLTHRRFPRLDLRLRRDDDDPGGLRRRDLQCERRRHRGPVQRHDRRPGDRHSRGLAARRAPANLVVAQLNPKRLPRHDVRHGSGFELINFGTSTPTGVLRQCVPGDRGPRARSNIATTVGLTTTISGVSTTTDAFAIARLNTNGSLDTTFNTTGMQTVSFNTGGTTPADATASGLVVQSNDSVVVVGSGRPADQRHDPPQRHAERYRRGAAHVRRHARQRRSTAPAC